MIRRASAVLAGFLALGLAACAEQGGSADYVPPASQRTAASAAAPPGASRAPVAAAPLPIGLQAPEASGASTAPPVALLAPLTGANAERGQALANAAMLALLQPGSPRLDVRDTAGTAAGAAAAAQAAIAAGDGLIIGPLTAAETAAVAAPAKAAGVPVLAFTNDASQAHPGVWPLGIAPAQQVRRLVGAAMADGRSHFAALLPPSDFGSAMGSALTQSLASAGAAAPELHVHDGGNSQIAAQIRDISHYAERRGPLDAKIKAAKALHTAAGRKEAAQLSREPIPPPPFEALLLADVGETLAWEASFLGYYDLDAPAVRLLGPALWATPAGRGGAALHGAWYAAPDPAARAGFDSDYRAKYGAAAPGLADFAYDAAAIARALAASGGYPAASLCRPEGFAGVDGVVAFQPDGTVRRGLAVFELRGGGPAIVDPAPASLSAPGI